jgi:outer membrane protein assembly factor BamB
VVFHVGGHDRGALTAFDGATGAIRWSWSGDGPGYGSPIVATFGGVRQIVTITQGKIVGIDPAGGALLWQKPFASPNFTNAFTPVVAGETVVVSGNGGPTIGLAVRRQNRDWVVESAWENADIPMRFSDAIVIDGVLFGLSNRNSGQYFAVDVRTGKTLWQSRGRDAGNAAISKTGNIVFSLEDDGELVVARASRAGLEPVRRYKVADTPTWAQPAVSGSRIFVKDESALTLWTVN